MKWNLNAAFGIALTALALTLFSVSDANAQSEWDFYSTYFSQPKSSSQQATSSYWSAPQNVSGPVTEISNQTSLNQAYQQLDTYHYVGEAGIMASHGKAVQTHPATNSRHRGVEAYRQVPGAQANLRYPSPTPAIICQSNT